ncbi:MlaD family protein [Nocardia nova]|uniref:MlaD family protein n=1 Tax=Nocardia nova TaxID=37330 RepID=UPI0033EF3BF5
MVAFGAAMILLLMLVVNAIQRPVSGDADAYTAKFTDVSGLKAGDDVRMFGVQVGKVQSIELHAPDAEVHFTVQRARPLYRASTIAIRYQTLTGTRYIDIRQPPTAGERLTAGSSIGTDRTVASFDITTLFNGLEPVLRQFSPGDLNQFTESMISVIEGNGSGIGPAMDSVRKLSDYVSDRQTVLSTLVRNLRAVSDEIGGRSPQLVLLLHGLNDVFTALNAQMDSLVDFSMTMPSVLGPLNDLLATLGLTTEPNPNLAKDIQLLFPDPQAALRALGVLPGLLQALDNLIPAAGPAAGEIKLTCSHGNATLPPVAHVLMSGQRITVCNK